MKSTRTDIFSERYGLISHKIKSRRDFNKRSELHFESKTLGHDTRVSVKCGRYKSDM